MTPQRVAGLDIGDKRIGVALSDPLGITAQPLGVVARVGVAADIRQILELLEGRGVGEVVAGLPLQMDGTEGEQAARVRRFCERLGEQTGLRVTYYDERLTTAESQRLLTDSGVRRSRRKQVVDKLAATLILQAWLDAGRPPGVRS